MQAVVAAVEYYVPKQVLSNDQLALEYPQWTADKILEKTGISERHIAAEDECSSDLGVSASQKLFATGVCVPEDIDYLLFCTQSPDYSLPTSACVMQDRLGIPIRSGALDFNLGCSGFVYGLGIAKGLIETGQARNVLLVTAETYTKFIHPGDRSVRTIFGDGAAATLIKSVDGAGDPSDPWIGPFVYGTDGRGAQNLIVPAGGMRQARTKESGRAVQDEHGSWRSADNLYMNGPEIFTFSLQAAPKSVKSLLARSGESIDDIDLVVFHQANKYMLDYLRKKIKLPEDKFYIALRDYGNTVSSTIPIALKQALDQGRLHPGDRIMVVGFGVGYSWAAALLRWSS